MIKYLISILGILSLSCTAFSQTTFLTVPNDARSLSLGGVGASSSATAYSIFNNTAATALSSDVVNVGVNYMYWQPSALQAHSMAVAGFFKPMENLSVALGVRYERQSNQTIFDANGAIGDTFTPNGLAVDLGVAYRIFEGFSAGVNLRYISSTIYKDMDSAFGGDIHFMYQIAGANIGLTVNNIGTKLDAISQPMNVKLGGSYEVLKGEQHSLVPMLQVGYIVTPKDMASITAAIGLEYSFDSKYYVRAGYSYADKTKFMPDHASVGVGVKVAGIAIDAAYLIATETKSPIRNTFSVNVSWALTK